MFTKNNKSGATIQPHVTNLSAMDLKFSVEVNPQHDPNKKYDENDFVIAIQALAEDSKATEILIFPMKKGVAITSEHEHIVHFVVRSLQLRKSYLPTAGDKLYVRLVFEDAK